MAVKLISSRIFGECLPYGCSVLNCTSAIRSNTFPVRRHWENDCDMAVVFLIAHLRYALTISQSKSSCNFCVLSTFSRVAELPLCFFSHEFWCNSRGGLHGTFQLCIHNFVFAEYSSVGQRIPTGRFNPQCLTTICFVQQLRGVLGQMTT